MSHTASGETHDKQCDCGFPLAPNPLKSCKRANMPAYHAQKSLRQKISEDEVQAINCLLTWEAFWWRLHLQVREKEEGGKVGKAGALTVSLSVILRRIIMKQIVHDHTQGSRHLQLRQLQTFGGISDNGHGPAQLANCLKIDVRGGTSYAAAHACV